MSHPSQSMSIRSRHGVSLMEVLFSIGVVSIGLLGVVALLPLAANQVRKGEEAEQGAAVGMNALNEIEMRGMTYAVDLDQDGDYGGTGPTDIVAATGAPGPDRVTEIETNWVHPGYNVGNTVGPRQSVCIDPRYVADNTGSGVETYFPHRTAALATQARMRRVSIRNGVNGGVMSAEVAERIFVDHDRLDFNRPKDDTLPAVQLYDAHGPAATPAVPKLIDSRRQLSWFATLVPKFGPGSGAGNLATLSVVVVEGRPSLLDITNDPVALATERVVTVTSFYSGGIGGGDVQLTSLDVPTLEQVKVGYWIMLAGKALVRPPAPPSRPLPELQDYFAWYRVGAKTEINDVSGAGTGPYTMDVTLAGPDWNRPEWTAGLFMTEAVIVEGVIGVYQRTIRREVANMWN